MRYRVLLPYLTVLTKIDLPNSYEIWRTIMLWLAMMAVAGQWGFSIAVLWLVFVMSAQIWDTWCYTGEAIGISLALSGNPFAALAGILVHGMSRETVLLNGFIYWLATGDVVTGIVLTFAAVAVYLFVRLYQGIKPLYCDRFLLKQNIEQLKKPTEPFIFYAPYINLIAIALALFGAILSGSIGWAVPVLVSANVIMGKIDEYRLQIAVAPWIGLALLELL